MEFEKTLTEALSDITLSHIINNIIMYMEYNSLSESTNNFSNSNKIRITKYNLSKIIATLNEHGLPKFISSEEKNKPCVVMKLLLESLLKQKIDVKNVNIIGDMADVIFMSDRVIRIEPIVDSTNGILIKPTV